MLNNTGDSIVSPISANNDSPALRSTILPLFLRRPRGTPAPGSQNLSSRDLFLEELTQAPALTTHSTNPGHRRRPPTGTIQPSVSATPPPTSSLGLSHMLRRRRSAGAMPPINTSAATANGGGTVSPATLMTPPRLAHNPSSAPGGSSNATHRIRLVPHLDTRRSLKFEPISRDLREGDLALRIGRFTERSGIGVAAVNALNSNKLAFKSKVVSRAHAEIWVDASGKFMIKDTKSSSGTFLNHVRLSAANQESRAFQLKDGDILQLGVDYQGGTEDIYKSVKIRVEIGREWQGAANAFNTNALKNLRTLAATGNSATSPACPVRTPSKTNIPDCCICLFTVTIRQALFIAPCSHTFHFKCIKPLLDAHHPAFSCPLCRTFADLDEDVEVEADHDLLDMMDDEHNHDDVAHPSNASGAAAPSDHEGTGSGSSDHGGGVVPPTSASSAMTVSNAAAPLSLSPLAHLSTEPHGALLLPPPPYNAERERERDAGAETEVEGDVMLHVPSGAGGAPRTPRASVRSSAEGGLAVLSMPSFDGSVVDLTSPEMLAFTGGRPWDGMDGIEGHPDFMHGNLAGSMDLDTDEDDVGDEDDGDEPEEGADEDADPLVLDLTRHRHPDLALPTGASGHRSGRSNGGSHGGSGSSSTNARVSLRVEDTESGTMVTNGAPSNGPGAVVKKRPSTSLI